MPRSTQERMSWRRMQRLTNPADLLAAAGPCRCVGSGAQPRHGRALGTESGRVLRQAEQGRAYCAAKDAGATLSLVIGNVKNDAAARHVMQAVAGTGWLPFTLRGKEVVQGDGEFAQAA
jgi:hypothetical protein